MISVATVVNILMLLYFHILNATTSQWTLEEVHHSEVERFLPPDHQCVKTTNQIVGRGQEVGAGGDRYLSFWKVLSAHRSSSGTQRLQQQQQQQRGGEQGPQ